MTYAHERVARLTRQVGSRVASYTKISAVYIAAESGAPHATLSNAQFWSKIERRVFVAVLDELVVQCKDSRFPGAKTLRVKVGNTRDLLAHQPVATALGLFDASYDALRRELYGLSYGVPADYHVHVVNTACAALCLPRDPLALWDYMLEQLWLSAHDKTGGEAGMAQRLHDALITIFEEEGR